MALTVSTKRALLGSFAASAVDPGVFSATFGGFLTAAPSLAAYTFEGVDIGTPAATRQIVFAFGSTLSASGLISAVSINIGGSPVTLDWAGQGVKQAAASTRQLGIVFANIPTGTTADITLDTAAAQLISRVGLMYWVLRNSSLTAPAGRSAATPVSNASTAGPLAAGPVTVPAGGFLLGAAYQADTNAISATITSGVLFEEDDQPLSGGATQMAAYRSAVAGSQDLSVTNAGGTLTNMRVASVAVGP